MPDGPTPPNGSVSCATCSRVSLTETPPAWVARSIASVRAASWSNQYSASGRGRALTKAIASATAS